MATSTHGIRAGAGSAAEITGAQYMGSTDQTGNLSQILPSHSPIIYGLNTKETVFTTFLNKLGSRVGRNTEYIWQEDKNVPYDAVTTGSVAALGGTVTLTSGLGARFIVNDTLFVPNVATTAGNGAQGWITGVSGDVLSVTWTTNHAPTSGIASGTTVLRLGNTYEEIDQVEIGPTMKPAQLSNPFQCSMHALMASDTYVQGDFRFDPTDWERKKDLKRRQHLLEKEFTTTFGQSNTDTSGSFPRKHMKGIYYWASTNVTQLEAALTKARLDTFLDTAMNAHPEPGTNWIMFQSDRIQEQTSQLANSLERSDTTAEQFGMGIGQYKAPNQQVVKFVHHYLFKLMGMNDMAMLINFKPEVLSLVYHSIFNTKEYEAILERGLTAIEVYWRTVWTLMFCGESINISILEDVEAS